MQQKNPHIAIVGGGIAGSYAAYFLAGEGVSTTLVEHAEIAHGASGFNPGGLNPLHGTGVPGPLQAFQWESFEVTMAQLERVRDLSGIDPGFRRYVRVHIALGDGDLPSLEKAHTLHQAAPGFSARWLERDELLALEPRLNPALVRGLWAEGNGKIESAAYTRAVAAAAAKLGAKIVIDEAVGVVGDGGLIRGIILRNSGFLACDGAMIATGSWAAGPSKWLGVRIPVEPVKGDLLFVRAAGGAIAHNFSWRDTAIYGNGTDEIWLGGTDERVGHQTAPAPHARKEILENACRIFPSMKEAVVLKQGAGLRPVASDDIPIVGWAPGWSNVALGMGGGRKGMLLGAGMGKAVADLFLRGRTDLSVTACGPERFATGSPESA